MHARGKARKRRGAPARSVDPQQKAKRGHQRNRGRAYEPQGHPRATATPDFLEHKKGKVVPYGVYDRHRHEAGVARGIRPDTAACAVAALRLWGTKLGKEQAASRKRLLMTAARGGSNAARSRRWKRERQRWAEETGVLLEGCPSPPGPSNWHKIAPRLFCHMTRPWRGVPLETRELGVSRIGNPRTTAG
jgi:hypothetical protein